MNLLLILAALALLGLGAWAVSKPSATLKIANDSAGGIHPTGRITRKVAAGNTIVEGMLVKLVSGEIAICGATDVPYGVAEDSVAAGEFCSVALLGAATGTVRMIASAAITAPALLVPTANGEVAALGADGALVSETRYYVVGHAVENGVADETFEVAPTFAPYSYTEDTVSP